MWFFGTRVLKMENKRMVMTISAATSVCGTSAAIATAAACKAKKTDLTFAVGVSLIFTVIMMVTMPLFCKLVAMDEMVGGAWIGGTVDSTGAVVLAGNALGAHDNQKMKDFARTILKLEIFLMVISGSLLFILAPIMMTIFTKDAEVIQLGSTVLRMVAVSEPIYGVAILIEGMMQGVGETVTPFKFNILGMWGIRIVGTLICTQFLDMGLISAWACMITHNVVLFLMFVAYYQRGRWNPLNSTI